jgi:tetratricopeptide (TPR) repeat protein
MKAVWWSAAMLAATMTMAMQGQDNANAKQLADAAKHAHDAGDLPKQAEDLCRAAVLDPKFQKRCDKAKEDLSKALSQFEASYNQAVFEARHKDFAGAVRDLSKITFGPHRAAAQALLPQLRVVTYMGSPEEISRTALQLANAFYAAGKLDEAESWLKYVTVPGMQEVLKQMETNIRVYRSTMRAANQLLTQQDLNGAAQKFQFAASIVPNGPGDPKGQLQQIQTQMAAIQHSTDQSNTQQAVSKPKDANTAKIQSLLETGSKDEARRDMRGAAKAYAAVLALDPNQKDAIAGRMRAAARPAGTPKALEALLQQGVTQFYAAQYMQASDMISSYLSKGGKLHEGAAQFYMGATLTAMRIVANPQDTQHGDELRQQAQRHFQAARKLKFEPVKNAVSPKILDQWTQTGDTQ